METHGNGKALSNAAIFVIGLQHAFTMFGATVLVPYLTGVPVNVALFTAGVGTLLFHLITKWKVPVFLGSSFAYISPMIAVTLYYINQGPQSYESIQQAINAGVDIIPMLAYATGGILIAGFVKFGIGILVKFIGIKQVKLLFPPVVSGTTIMLIGLILSPIAISMAAENWWIAMVSLAAAVVVRLYVKGFNRLLPVIWGIVAGYFVAIITGNIDFSNVLSARWFGSPNFYLPKFSLHALSVIVPVAIAPAIEHFGDIFAVSEVTGKKFYEDPGIHRTLMGDGLATSLGGFFGGPANTTYSENIGVLAITRVFNPWVMRIAAIFAIILSFVPKVGAIIQSIPIPVMGGIEILLFGMIAAVGLKSLVKNQVKIEGKNLITISVMLVIGLGGAKLTAGSFTLEGLGLAAIVGLALNAFFTLTKAPEE